MSNQAAAANPIFIHADLAAQSVAGLTKTSAIA
jgi:hypothetical protein